MSNEWIYDSSFSMTKNAIKVKILLLIDQNGINEFQVTEYSIVVTPQTSALSMNESDLRYVS